MRFSFQNINNFSRWAVETMKYPKNRCFVAFATANLLFIFYVVNFITYESGSFESEENSFERKRDLSGVRGYSSEKFWKMHILILKKAPALDEELVSFVKEAMDYPAPKNRIKMSRFLIKTPQVEEVEKILKNKTKGFYVEAGAFDGERSSNTIWLEENRDWTGLLVEPDTHYYTQLIGKNRHSWSINGGIGPYNYMSELPKTKQHMSFPCYPLLTLLTAIGNTQVDYFSLDVEGAEEAILDSLPFDKINITTLSVNYGHGNKTKILEIMEKKGYEKVKDIDFMNEESLSFVRDYIFTKKGYNH